MTRMAEQVSDRELAAAVAVPSDAVTARDDEWVVGVDATGEPTIVVPAVGAPEEEVPSFVIVDATTPVSAAIRSTAFTELEVDGVAVVIGDGNVVGVWHGSDLAAALVGGGARSAGDSELHGKIKVGRPKRSCKYTESGWKCTASLTFPTKPDPMPDCPNPAGLAPHLFGW